ncbi:MAG: thiamine pyrophosphate-dependent dehydrogenase E1 component subunit alpha [Parachlamydiaceae bacterium]|nr:thiamine pyrophosphate-dependent dehydrogenase E1 component subunit alpha [Parachlamydiaceae bacterium]
MDRAVNFDQIETISCLDEKGVLSSNFKNTIDDQIMIKGYKIMLLTRHIDERMITLQRQGLITFALSSYGEEACSVASAAALEMTDWIYPQYRENGAIFWRGFTPKQYVDHMFCNASDLIHGRQMPNHFGSRELNIVQVSSPIGTKIPHAAGCAYAMKLLNEKNVAVCYFGEGATSEGDFHVGLNFAAVRKVPAIFFCRNNHYAISTPSEQQFASDGIAPKGIGYGIQAVRVDGNDFIAVYDVVRTARKRCVEGHGPVLIEAMTYRLGSHSTSDDPTLYRSEEEFNTWAVKDPLLRLKIYLEGRGLWNDDKENECHARIVKDVDEAIAEAKLKGKPDLHTMVEDVYFAVPQTLESEYKEMVDALQKE